MIGENRPDRGGVPGDMNPIRRSVTILLILLAAALAACTPGAGGTQPPGGASTPGGGNPTAPSVAPGSYGY
jgi:hypothetical protein